MNLIESTSLRLKMIKELDKDDPIARIYLFSLFKNALILMNPQTKETNKQSEELFNEYLAMFHRIYGPNTEDPEQLFKQKRFGQLVDYFNKKKITKEQYPEIYSYLDNVLAQTTYLIINVYPKLQEIAQINNKEPLEEYKQRLKEGYELIQQLVLTSVDPNLLFFVLITGFGNDPEGLSKAFELFEYIDIIISEYIDKILKKDN